MTKKYKHLSAQERELMSVLHAIQTSISEIARQLNRSKSTICMNYTEKHLFSSEVHILVSLLKKITLDYGIYNTKEKD